MPCCSRKSCWRDDRISFSFKSFSRDAGYHLLKDVWGQGIATKSCKAVADYAFKVLKLKRLIAVIDTRNPASIRVVEKIGFQFEKRTVTDGIEDARYAIESTG